MNPFDHPASRALRALLRHGPMNMRQFTEASSTTPPTAKRLRETLIDLGLVSVRDLGDRGFLYDIEIALTERGHKVAKKEAETHAIMDGK